MAIFWVLLHQLVVVTPTSTLERVLLWPAHYGWVGVTLFFVLSGYLITGVLLDTRQAPRRVSSFYARRALRILPLYVLLLTLVFGASAAAGGALGVDRLTGTQAASFWLLLGNWAMADAGGYLVGTLAITWSVAIEEQFYLVWPWFAWALRPKRLAWFAGLVVVASLGVRLAGQGAGWSPVALYVLTVTRLDALALGALAAIAVREGFDPARWCGPLWGVLAVAGLAAAGGDLAVSLADASPLNSASRWSLGPGITLGAIAGAALLLLLASPDAAPRLTRLFESAWLRSFGLVSYGIYLTHSPIRAVIRDHLYGPVSADAAPWVAFPLVLGSPLPALALYMVVCVPLCWLAGVLSYRLVERPFLRLKRLFPATDPVL